MKKNSTVVIMSIIIFFIKGNIISQDFEAGNKIFFDLKSKVQKNEQNIFNYEYELYNRDSSLQNIEEFKVILRISPRNIHSISKKNGWYGPSSHIYSNLPNWVAWIADSLSEIRPGNIEKEFFFLSSILPGIIEFYCEGAHKIPWYPEGVASDSIPGYDDLTPYGPGKIGITVGPVLIDDNNIIDSLLSYNSYSRKINWIYSQFIVDKYNNFLTNAKSALQENKFILVRSYLQDILREVDIDNNSTITSEAYALLRYNTEYLLSKLPR